jgi:pimeloyl-ACP methyl ester carboxylesterase
MRRRDRQGSEGMLGRFRVSPEHATDIAAVIAYLKRRSQVPVWLVGTSRGTESAAHVAAHTPESLGGLVLTSSVTVTGRKGVSVTDMPLERITVPTLITAHRTDACSETPPAGAEQIRRRLTRAAKVEVRHFDGGDTPRSNACGALSYHGYLGIEKEVVDAITGFIKANGPTQAVAVMPATTGIQKE